MSARTRRWRWLALALCLLGSAAARAESAFELAYPAQLGPVPAATYDVRGHRVGEADVLIERMEDGRLRMVSHTRRADGASSLSTALFEVVVPDRTLRLVQQTSQSRDASGRAHDLLRIDHETGVASCTSPDGEHSAELPLPAQDRVVNVPMNLFFLPLVRGETDRIDFQIFLCGGGPRLVDFYAYVADGAARDRRQPIEVRYAPDYGVASFVARELAPRLSFWFDPTPPYGWAGHRIPLYSDGPEVLVVRDGISSAALADD